jgi:hypothetical protein
MLNICLEEAKKVGADLKTGYAGTTSNFRRAFVVPLTRLAAVSWFGRFLMLKRFCCAGKLPITSSPVRLAGHRQIQLREAAFHTQGVQSELNQPLDCVVC